MRTLARRPVAVLFLLLPVLLAGRGAGADEWGDARKAFRRAQRSDAIAVRRDSYTALLSFDGADAVEEILWAMGKEENPAVLLTAMETLSLFVSDEAIQALLGALGAAKGQELLHLVVAMGYRTDAVGTAPLIALAGDKDPMLAAQAALALGRMGAKDALPSLLALLEREEWQLRSAGARAMCLLAGPAPEPPKANEKPKPWLPPGLDAKALLPPLAAALERARGRDRGDVIEVLQRLSGQSYGNDPVAWTRLAEGAPPETIQARAEPTPHVFGIPIYGRRIVLLVDISTCTDDTHPFADVERLKAVCAVPGARSVPWYEIRTTKQFLAAHAKRLVDDLPGDARFDVIAVYQKIEPVFGKLTPVNSGTQKQATDFLEALTVQGGPNHYEGLMAALDISGTRDSVAWSLGPDEIVLMTCAIPWAPKDPSAIVGQEEVGRIVGLKARLRMVVVHTVGVGPHPFGMMKAISDLSGGTYVDLSK